MLANCSDFRRFVTGYSASLVVVVSGEGEKTSGSTIALDACD